MQFEHTMNNDWLCERLLKRSEQYIKDAQDSIRMGWVDCAKSKIGHAEFCLTLAEHIREGIQEF